ncbi:putative prophage CPS-53 integrase [compost metagenome]
MLTDAHCRNAKPREKLYRLNDHKGLYLEVKPSGVKAWRYRYTLHGNASMYALGDYPDVKLSEARQLCEGARDRSIGSDRSARRRIRLSLSPRSGCKPRTGRRSPSKDAWT